MGKFDSKRIQRKVKDTILIVCGGNTEKLYFTALNQKYKAETSQIQLCIEKESKDPLSIVQFAIKCRDEKYNNGINETWVVFDKDDFEEKFYHAIELAKNEEIKVAYSNQAFELWFIQHFKCINTTLHRDKYKSEIDKLLKQNLSTNTTYSKKPKDLKKFFEIILDSALLDKAINNSKIAYGKRKLIDSSNPFGESSTNVFKLVERLRKS